MIISGACTDGRSALSQVIRVRALQGKFFNDFSRACAGAHALQSVKSGLGAGVAPGARDMQGLHAQAGLKAYSVVELEIFNTAAQADYLSKVREAVEAAHGHALRTLNGRVVSIEGSPPPQHAAIDEWDSLDDAVAFYHSKAWTDFAPQRDKSQRTIRRYVVEVEK